MPRETRLRRIKSELADFLKYQDYRILTRTSLSQLLEYCRDEWNLPQSVTLSKFRSFLIDEIGLKVEKCSFPSREYTRYTVGEQHLYSVMLSLIPDSYLSHFTALDLHGLTETSPDRVYLNYPQERKSARDSSLAQSGIDRAFKGPARLSRTSAQFRGNTVLLLNSMGSRSLGIMELDGPESTRVRATDVERTLIDIVVRPVYSGGVSNVLAAYRKAAQKVSVIKLVETLKELDFAYPYHQAIGFYLERSGYRESEIALLREFPITFDFYLDYQMADPEYSKEWRLYFPRGLK